MPFSFRSRYASFRRVVLLAAAIVTLPGLAAAQASVLADTLPFLDPSRPVERRVNDLDRAHDARREDLADGRSRRGHPAAEGALVRLVERVAPRRRVRGYATTFPQVIGMAATWDTALVHQMGDVISTEARAKYHEAVREDDRAMVLRAHLLGAQRQHLPRSALGARPGDLRRGSVPHRPHGRRVRARHAGR